MPKHILGRLCLDYDFPRKVSVFNVFFFFLIQTNIMSTPFFWWGSSTEDQPMLPSSQVWGDVKPRRQGGAVPKLRRVWTAEAAGAAAHGAARAEHTFARG